MEAIKRGVAIFRLNPGQLTWALIILNLSRWHMGPARWNWLTAEFPLKNG